jgi:hypothetical protein
MTQAIPSTTDVRIDNLLSEAQQSISALGHFLDLFEAGSVPKYGIDLDTADDCICTAAQFVRSYRKLFGDPVR